MKYHVKPENISTEIVYNEDEDIFASGESTTSGMVVVRKEG